MGAHPRALAINPTDASTPLIDEILSIDIGDATSGKILLTKVKVCGGR
jgi:hypothetical protein